MERWVGKVAIVTGASSGLGEAIADSLVKAGMQVVGLARRVERMQKNADALIGSAGKLYAIKCDVTIEEDIIRAFEWTTKNVGLVHVLINNAGAMSPTNLIAGDTKKWRSILDTNILGVCIGTREASKIMMENNIPGQIIHMSSIAGVSNLYFSTMNVYGASKHALGNLADLLRQELAANKSQIRVTNICPGPAKSEMFVPENFPPEFADFWDDIPVMESQDVADVVLYILSTPHRVNINEIVMRPTRLHF